MYRTKKLKAADLAQISLFASIIAICSWICIPAVVPFTLQTFGVFLAVAVLGGKRGTLAVVTYLLMGSIGLPVFAGFGGGLGYFMGSTGGYMIGFLFSALVMWGLESLWGKSHRVTLLSMILGLFVCYTFGTVWFLGVYASTDEAIGFWTVLTLCVFPYVVPDVVKLMLVIGMRKRLVQVCRTD